MNLDEIWRQLHDNPGEERSVMLRRIASAALNNAIHNLVWEQGLRGAERLPDDIMKGLR